jgi:hypothetical protein
MQRWGESSSSGKEKKNTNNKRRKISKIARQRETREILGLGQRKNERERAREREEIDGFKNTVCAKVLKNGFKRSM